MHRKYDVFFFVGPTTEEAAQGELPTTLSPDASKVEADEGSTLLPTPATSSTDKEVLVAETSVASEEEKVTEAEVLTSTLTTTTEEIQEDDTDDYEYEQETTTTPASPTTTPTKVGGGGIVCDMM